MFMVKIIFVYFFLQVGRTALFKTVERCDEFAVKLLLNKGALVNIADKDGMTALHVSIPTYSPTLVYLLVSKGAIIDATDNVSHNYAPHVQVSVNRSTRSLSGRDRTLFCTRKLK